MDMIEEYIKFERNNIEVFAKENLVDLYDKELFEPLLDTYIKTRYYNYYDEENDNLEESIFNQLNKTLTKQMDGTDPETKDKLAEMYVLFNYILCFDDVNLMDDKGLIKLLCDHRKDLFGTFDSIFQEKITKLLASTQKKRNEFFEFLGTEDFSLERNTTNRDEVIDLVLDHHLKFPKIYSSYAIERVFNQEDIGEDKLLIEYYLVTDLIIKDIKSGTTNNKYLIEFNTSLYENKEKLQKVLTITGNECYKNQAVFKIDLDDYAKYGNDIKDMIREGYKFAIYIGRENIDDDLVLFNAFEYIIVAKNSRYCKQAKDNDKILMIYDK